MTFISYAQNFEDVMLWRALNEIENGFYIDVGAAWPAEHSVTKAFYDRGWKGINIEPNPQLLQELRSARSRDLNLGVAVGDQEGILPISIVPDTGLSTLDDLLAVQHEGAGRETIRQLVEVTTLAAVWTRYVPEGQPVHFMKVDVEGLETAVLNGNDWNKNRPWVVVVESTAPMSKTETYEAWESILLHADYELAYMDGLNRFYLAAERVEVRQAFKYPPNIFDNFTLNTQVQIAARAASLDVALIQAQTQLSDAEARAVRAELRAAEAEAAKKRALVTVDHIWAAHQSVIHSRSWRITKPYRSFMGIGLLVLRGCRAWLSFAAGSRPHRIARRLILSLAQNVLQRPRFKMVLRWLLNRFPSMKAHIQTFYRNAQIQSSVERAGGTSDNQLNELSPHARRIYMRFDSGIHKSQGAS